MTLRTTQSRSSSGCRTCPASRCSWRPSGGFRRRTRCSGRRSSGSSARRSASKRRGRRHLGGLPRDLARVGHSRREDPRDRELGARRRASATAARERVGATATAWTGSPSCSTRGTLGLKHDPGLLRKLAAALPEVAVVVASEGLGRGLAARAPAGQPRAPRVPALRRAARRARQRRRPARDPRARRGVVRGPLEGAELPVRRAALCSRRSRETTSPRGSSRRAERGSSSSRTTPTGSSTAPAVCSRTRSCRKGSGLPAAPTQSARSTSARSRTGSRR